MKPEYLIVLVIYLIVLITIGVWSERSARTLKQYIIGGRTLGPFVLAATWASTWVSASCFLGAPGLAYKFGWAAMAYQTGMLGGLAVPLVLVGKRLCIMSKKLDALSIPDFIAVRYESKFLRIFVAIVVALLYIPLMIAQFKGAGIASAEILGISYSTALLTIGIVILVYTILGGFRAVAYTDAFQSIVMGIAVIIAIPLLISRVGGFDVVDMKLAAQSPNLVSVPEPVYFTTSTIIASFFFGALTPVSQPYIAVRFQALRNWKEFKKVFIYAAIFNVVFLITPIMGLIARAEMPNLPDPDMAAPAIIAAKLPGALSAVLLVGILAAMMSSTDSILLTAGTAISYDALREVPLEEKKRTMLSRIIIGILGLLSLYFAITKPPRFLSLLLYFGVGGLSSTLFGPLVLGLYSTKPTKRAAEIGVVLSATMYMILYLWVFDKNPFKATAVGCAFSIIITYLLSLITKQTISNKTLEVVSEALREV